VGEERKVEENGGEEREGKKIDGCPLTELRCRIIEQHHNMCITGYVGRFKNLELVACNY
jgi:hypothetical protein